MATSLKKEPTMWRGYAEDARARRARGDPERQQASKQVVLNICDSLEAQKGKENAVQSERLCNGDGN